MASSESDNTQQGDPPGRWRALTVLGVAMVLSMATWFSASAVLPQLRAHLSLSTTEASWLIIAVQLGFVAGAVVSAFASLADVVAPKRLMFAGSMVAGLANLGLLIAPGSSAAIGFVSSPERRWQVSIHLP